MIAQIYFYHDVEMKVHQDKNDKTPTLYDEKMTRDLPCTMILAEWFKVQLMCLKLRLILKLVIKSCGWNISWAQATRQGGKGLDECYLIFN